MSYVNPNPGFVPESWSLYGVGAFLVALRIVGKIHRVGFKGLELDDGFIAFGFLWYTILVVAFNQMLNGAGSNLMTDEEVAALTPEITESRIRGSKWVFVSEHGMLLTIWSMKAAMLILYARIIDKLAQRRLLNMVMIWVVCAFLGDEIALFTICRPLSQYWAVPAANPQCSTYQYYQIVNAVFNISTDLLILGIGIPPVMKARLSVQQKAILGVVFGMGIFVIVAAILRAIYCLVPALISYVYMNWYFREASVAVYVTTLPGIWVFLRDIFPFLRTMTSRTGTKPTNSNTNPQQMGWNGHHHASKNRSQLESKDLDFDLDTYPISKSIVTATESDLAERGLESPEHAHGGDASSTSSAKYEAGLNEIRRDVTFSVERVPRGQP